LVAFPDLAGKTWQTAPVQTRGNPAHLEFLWSDQSYNKKGEKKEKGRMKKREEEEKEEREEKLLYCIL
jgi:hypothetical protein